MAAVLKVGIYQPAARDEAPAARLARLETVLAGLGQGALDLLICPELYLSGYHIGDQVPARAEASDGPFAQAAADLARRFGTALLYGYPEAAGDQTFNSALCLGKAGERLANHRKLLLSGASEKAQFAPYDGMTLFDLAAWRIAILICYDIEFPENARAAAQAGADLIAAPTALGAEWDVVARKLVPARAFENGLFLAYANHAGVEAGMRYLGESRIVGPDGRELATAGGDETVITAELDKTRIDVARARLPYLSDCRRLKT